MEKISIAVIKPSSPPQQHPPQANPNANLYFDPLTPDPNKRTTCPNRAPLPAKSTVGKIKQGQGACLTLEREWIPKKRISIICGVTLQVIKVDESWGSIELQSFIYFNKYLFYQESNSIRLNP